jgi:hypothetical protein
MGTTALVLADGKTIVRLTALGEVVVQGQSQIGVIVLDPGSTDVLVGIEFLESFKKTLIISPGKKIVELVDDRPEPPQPT